MLEPAERTGHYIDASQDAIRALAPSLERDRAAGNLSKVGFDNATFLKDATDITLAQLEAAAGTLAIAARDMCKFG